MGLSFGQLVGGMGIVANSQREAETAEMQNRLNLLRVQEQNRLENERAQQAPITADYLNNLNFTQPQTGNVMFGNGTREIPVEKPAVVAQPQPQVQQQPAPQVRPGLITVPKSSAVTPQAQAEFNQSIAVQPAKVEPFKPGVAMFAGKNFDFLRDGPSLVNPLLNSQGQMNEQAYTATRDALAKSMQDAKTKMQAAGPFAGNEELFYYKNQLDYLDTTYNSLKRQGKVVAATAPVAQQAPAPLDKRVAVDSLGGYQLPNNQLKRLNGLQDAMVTQLQQPATQALVKRAQEIGVDPAAAVAVFALENNYGGQKPSGAGAAGSMQVMPGTYADVRKIFTDPKSNVPPQLQQLAAALPTDMSKATPEQLRDAGLLYMYYLQNDKKIPTNMLGAAYHAVLALTMRHSNKDLFLTHTTRLLRLGHLTTTQCMSRCTTTTCS
ncbi:MAG: lytic transglycosylase domain-containing protein [Micrococcales bacterium]|nr:lytic transglycosylase domain-containing protein [Micrococcales bacterium]